MATQKTTITRAIRRAIKKGYDPVPGRKVLGVSVTLQNNLASYVTFILEGDKGKTLGITVGLNDLLFDHPFAQALWGDGCKQCAEDNGEHAFHESFAHYHLKQLALIHSVAGRVSYIGGAL